MQCSLPAWTTLTNIHLFLRTLVKIETPLLFKSLLQID